MPGSKMLPNYPTSRYKTVVAMGDSMTRNLTYGVSTSNHWLELLCGKLRAVGLPVQGRNLGRAGDTTTQMVARTAGITQVDTPTISGCMAPTIGIIEGGVNDPAGSINSATTTANIISLANTFYNAGTRMIVIVYAHYLNFASGGDTQSTDYAAYVPVRAAQLSAFNTLNAAHAGVFIACDWHADFSNLIATNVETQGSASWHWVNGNQHWNQLGHTYAAQFVYNHITAQSTWMTALQAPTYPLT